MCGRGGTGGEARGGEDGTRLVLIFEQRRLGQTQMRELLRLTQAKGQLPGARERLLWRATWCSSETADARARSATKDKVCHNVVGMKGAVDDYLREHY
jgi:hypothetical protein